jgi:hypothetical protein
MVPALTIITGAQTGVDTAAINTAIKYDIAYKGWVPRGCTNESGPILPNYRSHFTETPSQDNAQRTEWNIRHADYVLTILRGQPEKVAGGTAWGIDVARATGKEMCFVDLSVEWANELDKIKTWLSTSKLEHLKCAVNGPRESEEPGIEEEATKFLCEALKEF